MLSGTCGYLTPIPFKKSHSAKTFSFVGASCTRYTKGIFKSLKCSVFYKLSIVLAAFTLLFLLKTSLVVGVSSGGVSSETGELTRYSFGYLLTHPLNVLLLLCRTLYTYLDTYVFGVVGQQLGHLQGSLSTMSILSFAYLAVLFDVSQIGEEDDGLLSVKGKPVYELLKFVRKCDRYPPISLLLPSLLLSIYI